MLRFKQGCRSGTKSRMKLFGSGLQSKEALDLELVFKDKDRVDLNIPFNIPRHSHIYLYIEEKSKR